MLHGPDTLITLIIIALKVLFECQPVRVARPLLDAHALRDSLLLSLLRFGIIQMLNLIRRITRVYLDRLADIIINLNSEGALLSLLAVDGLASTAI